MSDQSLKYDEEFRAELIGELPEALDTISDTFNVSRKDVSDVFTEAKIDDALYFRGAAAKTKWGGGAILTLGAGTFFSGILASESGEPMVFLVCEAFTLAATGVAGVCGKIGASKARKKYGDDLNDYIEKSKAEMQSAPPLQEPQ